MGSVAPPVGEIRPQLTVQCEQAADTAMEQWERSPFAVVAKGRIAVIKGDAAAARSAYEQFKEIVGDEVRVLFFEDNDQLLGTFAVSFGDFDLAEEHFAMAIARLDQGGFRMNLAEALYEYGTMLLARDGGGDREKANELLERALHLSRDIGMPWLTERVLARREILGA